MICAIEFAQQDLTSYAGLELLRRKFRLLDLHRRIRQACSRQVTRTQRRSEGTVVVAGVDYEVPSRFRTLATLRLRAPGWDPSELALPDPRTGQLLARLLPQDEAGIAAGARRTMEPAAAPAGTTPPDLAAADPLLALLRQWLAVYVATGLPPAYLLKDEVLSGEDRHDG